MDAGGQRLCASCSASTVPLSPSIRTHATGADPAARAGTRTPAIRTTATAVIRHIDRLPFDGRPRIGRPSTSGPERRERVGPRDQLIGLRPDHVPVTVELTVEQEPAHVTGATEEREE